MELETNGAGLISLDVLIWDGQRVPISYYVGGTCGNVMMILSHMGWDAYPIAHLDSTKDGVRVLDDLKRGVLSEDGIWNLLEDDRELTERLRTTASRHLLA